jgi:uncharacterized membrane protein
MTALLDAVFRWMHILVGILWIGHLYFFNFVNLPFQGKLDGPTKKAVNPELLPRALYWFRWGAFWTWVTGVVLLLLVFYHGRATLNDPTAGFTVGAWVMVAVSFLAVFVYDLILKSPLAANLKAAYAVLFVLLAAVVAAFVHVGAFSQRGTLIHTGALFGTIMAFNVWFRIWPAQQKIIRAVKEGTPPDAELVKMAGLRSRHNTYLSLPLFFAMINQHTTYFYGGNLGLTESTYWIGWLVIIGIALHIVWQLYRKSGKVEGF